MLSASNTRTRFGVAMAIAVAMHLAAYVLMPQPRCALRSKAANQLQLAIVELPPEPAVSPPTPPPKPEPPPPMPKPVVQPVAPVVAPPKVEEPKPQPEVKPLPPPKPMRVARTKPAAKPMAKPSESAPHIAMNAMPAGLPGDTMPGLPSPNATETVPAPAPTSSGDEKGIEGGFEPPAYCQCAMPKYPSDAKRQRQQGTVLLRLRLNARGQVEFVSVKDSSGYASLDSAATKAVKNWLFQPARKNGSPVAHEVEVPVKFALQN